MEWDGSELVKLFYFEFCHVWNGIVKVDKIISFRFCQELNDLDLDKLFYSELRFCPTCMWDDMGWSELNKIFYFEFCHEMVQSWSNYFVPVLAWMTWDGQS